MANQIFRLAAPIGSNILAAARAARDRAEIAAGATHDDAIQTGQDRLATGQDRTATGQDRTATGQDRQQTGLDRLATGQDRQAASDSAGAAAGSAGAALADRLLAQGAPEATAADRTATGLDRVAAASSAQAAAATVPANADRTVGRRLNDTAIWLPSRSTRLIVPGADGNFVEYATDTLAWTYSPATLAPLGVAFAPDRANAVTNSRCEGVLPGVVGSGGALPTGWSVSGQTILTEVLNANLSLMGLPGFSLRMSSAAATGSVFNLNIPGTLATVAGTDLIQASILCQQVGAAPVGITGVAIATSGFGAITVGATPSRQTSNRTAGGPATTMALRLNCTSGQPFDISMAVAAPGLSVGRYVPPVILPPPGAPAAAAVARTNVNIPIDQLGSRWNRRQGLILVDWASIPGAFTSSDDADWFGLVSWGDGSAGERMGLLLNPAHTSIEARMTAGGVAQAAASRALAAPAAGAVTRAALAWDLDYTSPGVGRIQVAARGAAGAVVAITTLPLHGLVMPGRYGTTHPAYAAISGLEGRPAALWDAALAALT